MNALQLLRRLGLNNPTETDLESANEILRDVFEAAADYIERADLDNPADPTSQLIPAQRYVNRRAGFLLRRMAPPTVRRGLQWKTT